MTYGNTVNFSVRMLSLMERFKHCLSGGFRYIWVTASHLHGGLYLATCIYERYGECAAHKIVVKHMLNALGEQYKRSVWRHSDIYSRIDDEKLFSQNFTHIHSRQIFSFSFLFTKESHRSFQALPLHTQTLTVVWHSKMQFWSFWVLKWCSNPS